jgi:co-chaperonin GroES (HSP10)
MNLRTSESIFAGISQFLEHAPGDITPIGDRVLVRDMGPFNASATVAISERANDKEQLRLGLVLAVGIGDSVSEHGLDADGRVRRRLLTRPCKQCETGYFFDARQYKRVPCPSCHGERRVPVVVPPQCNVGDKILYDRRKEAEFVVNGEKLSLIHAEQSVWAVVEE